MRTATIQSNWRIESNWQQTEPIVPEDVIWHQSAAGYDDYDGEELPIRPASPHPLSCECGSDRFRRRYKVWETEYVNEDGENVDYGDTDSCDDDSEYYECAECETEVRWRPI